MRIHQVKIKNFHFLADAALALEDHTIVIVGRSNSGKTFLSEIVRSFLADDSATFQLEDFSSACYDGFCENLEALNQGVEENVIRVLIPSIELRLKFQYDPTLPQLGHLSSFLENQPTKRLTAETCVADFCTLRKRISHVFNAKTWAEDPNDPNNRHELQTSALRGLVKSGFINAQRGLNDATSRESDVLAKTLEGLFEIASSASVETADKQIADASKAAVKDIQSQIDTSFGGQLKSLVPALKTFGYPRLEGQDLHTELLLDVRKLLSNFTKTRYAGYGNIALPESHNGLGKQNMIFILLQLAGFYKLFREEPIAHLIIIFFADKVALAIRHRLSY
ncbi:AAA family ATPase [Raoultella terrigena]|uniref:AAA family ATPase n=1 Tax=Raoultella terrigena TaxID=577 RepID=UPI003850283A